MYHGKRRYIGRFPSQEKAALANETARGILEPTLNSPLTAEEIDLNVSKAKEAAQKAALSSGIANSAEDNQVEVFHVKRSEVVGVSHTRGKWVRVVVFMTIHCI